MIGAFSTRGTESDLRIHFDLAHLKEGDHEEGRHTGKRKIFNGRNLDGRGLESRGD